MVIQAMAQRREFAMKLRKTSTAIVLGFGLGLLMTGLNPFAIAAEPDKINVCYSSIAATSITTWVPKEAGIYKKYGLDVSIIYVAGAQAITTLVSGDTQIVQGSGGAAALSRLSGSDLAVIATTINVIPMSLVTTRPRFKRQDLWSESFWIVDRLGSKKSGQRNGARPKQRYQNDSNRWRTGESPLPPARNHKRRAHFVTDFGTSERTGLQGVHESGKSQIPLSRNRARNH